MKLKITLLIGIFFIAFTNAQTKVGTVNSDLIISKMPQMKSVLIRIENYGKQLDSTFQIKTKDYTSKIDTFKKIEQTLSEESKKEKIKEITLLEQEMKKFRQKGSTMMQLRRDEYMRPLYKKLTETIAEIAKTNGYSQILTTNGNQFGYIDEKYDEKNYPPLDKLTVQYLLAFRNKL